MSEPPLETAPTTTITGSSDANATSMIYLSIPIAVQDEPQEETSSGVAAEPQAGPSQTVRSTRKKVVSYFYESDSGDASDAEQEATSLSAEKFIPLGKQLERRVREFTLEEPLFSFCSFLF